MAKGSKTVQKSKSESEVGSVVKKIARSEEVRQGILDAHQNIESSYVDMAELLAEAYNKEFFVEWGYTDFKDYCDQELDVQYRKAMYLVQVANCIKMFKIPAKTVEKLGWTKMKDLAAVMTEETAKEWLAKAKDMTSRELTEAVKIARGTDGSEKGNVPQVTTMTFRMGEAEANVITEALNEAKKLLEGGDNAQQTVLALEMICQDWLEVKGAVPERSRLSDHLKYLERIYGVTLTVKGKPKLVKKVEEEEVEEEEAPKPKKKSKKVVEEPEEEIEEEFEEEEAPKPKKKTKKEEAPSKGKKKAKKEEPAPKKKAKKAPVEEEEDDDPEEEEDDQDLNDILGI